MTERLLAALTDNGKWLEGFTRLGYESTFREYCDRFTPDYLAAVREAGESGLPTLADSLLDALEAQWKQARFWNRTTVRGETKQVVVGYLTPMLMADRELRPFAGVLRDRWNLRWPKDVYHAAGYERICKGFKLRILGFEVPEKKKRRRWTMKFDPAAVFEKTGGKSKKLFDIADAILYNTKRVIAR